MSGDLGIGKRKLPPEAMLHLSIFHPHTLKRMAQLEDSGARFVHYTNADTARKIIEGKTVWMRQASCMNDTLEIEHGIRCFNSAYKGPHGDRLRAVLKKIFPGLVEQLAKDFLDNPTAASNLRYDTFVASLSEHGGKGNIREDKYGRLSMWRAYGQGRGVALVVNPEPFWNTSTALGAFMSPVAYLDDEQFAEELGILATSLEKNVEYLQKIGYDRTLGSIINAFQFAIICTKHPGFEEEREWRIVASKGFPYPCTLTRAVETVGGIPQMIYSLPLEENEAAGLSGFSVPRFLEKLLIGPAEFPMALYDAFSEILKEANVPDYHNKLVVTHVPLRPSSP